VPLTLARLPADTDFAVIEIGMNHPGEIAPLARMARPHVALITTIAPAHLEAFGSSKASPAKRPPSSPAGTPAAWRSCRRSATAPILAEAAQSARARLQLWHRRQGNRLADAHPGRRHRRPVPSRPARACSRWPPRPHFALNALAAWRWRGRWGWISRSPRRTLAAGRPPPGAARANASCLDPVEDRPLT
jgi:UDP-N-acetylmuramoyl-tripeptide--D-alanyl-D-alanine ligase